MFDISFSSKMFFLHSDSKISIPVVNSFRFEALLSVRSKEHGIWVQRRLTKNFSDSAYALLQIRAG